MTRDVTEAERKFEDNEERYRRLVEDAPETIVVISEEKIVFINAAGVRLARVDGPEDLVGKPYLDFVHPDFRETARSRISRAREGETAELLQQKLLRPDGSTVDVEVVVIPTTYEGKPATQSLIRDITERKEAEEALRKSEANLAKAQRLAHLGSWEWDVETEEVTWSDEVFRIYGYEPKEFVPTIEKLMEVVHPDDRALVRKNIDGALYEGESYDFEHRIVRQDGEERIIHRQAEVVFDEKGEPWRMNGTVHDITERRRAEEKLRESEEWFRALVQNTSDIITILDADGTVSYKSPAVERVFGYKKEEMVGEKVFDYIHPEDVEQAKRTFAEVLESPGVHSPVRFRVRHVDSSWRHVEAIRNNLLEDPNVRGIVVNTRDITERKRVEAKLRESEERHRAVFEQSVEGIYLFDPGTKRVLESNAAFEGLIGYTSGEILQKEIYAFIAHEREDVDQSVQRSLEERRRPKHERKYRRKDGSLIDIELSTAVIPYRDGEAVCCLVHDVTERKEAEKKLRENEARLAKAQRIAGLGNWEWDLKTGEVIWSDEVFRIYGFTSGEFVPSFDKLMELVHPDDRERVRKKIDHALHENEPYDFNHRIVRPDGTERTVYRQAEVVIDEEGEPLRMVGTVHDITERKAAEDALRESEERFRSAFEDAPIGVALVDLDGYRFGVNRALCEMLGYSEEELLGEAYLDDLHPEDREISTKCFHQVLEGESESYTLERRYIHADGHVVWNLSSVSLVCDSQGDPSHFVCLHQDITERKILEDNLEHQAFHDSLTDLPNRALFLDRLEHAQARAGREGGSVAVLFVDLDGFKLVNDSLGHDAGNAVLVGVAERLQSSVRPGDTVGRIFGDEFAVLLEAPSGLDEACRVTERIEERLREPFDLDGQEVFVAPSIGIALGESAEDQPEEILRHADLAMYQAKRRGKARYEAYDPEMETRATERLDLENELRRAIEREEFEVHYQPIIELSTGRIAGMEALARWRHPERRLVAAAEFIVLAEETGLIRPIGQRVIEEACRQAKEWRERYADRAPLINVNLSANQFSNQPDLIPEILDETGLDPGGLQLEITERAVMDDAEFSLGRLQKLKGLGVSFAIDDYGMGYSCLYYLKRMPLDSLKIDRAFIAGLGEDPGDKAIVAGTIGLAHALGLTVTAEGVETAGQVTELKELGCDLAQGFHFAKPLPGEAMSELLDEDRRW